MKNYRLIISGSGDKRFTGLYIQLPFSSIKDATRSARAFCRDIYKQSGQKTLPVVQILSVSAPIGVIKSGAFNGQEIRWSKNG